MAGISSDPLSRVDGDRVRDADEVAVVIVAEDDVRLVIAAFSSKAIGPGVDGRDAPPVPIAHRRHRVGVRTWAELDGAVVTAADDISHTDPLSSDSSHGERIRVDASVVDPQIEGTGHIGGVTYQQGILSQRDIGGLGRECVGRHSDCAAAI